MARMTFSFFFLSLFSPPKTAKEPPRKKCQKRVSGREAKRARNLPKNRSSEVGRRASRSSWLGEVVVADNRCSIINRYL
jgi:hypothetical protein